MWANDYAYFNIFHDKELTVCCDTYALKKFLTTFSGLKQGGSFKFNNNATFPFVEILLLKAKSVDAWSDKETHPEKTNLVTIVCTKEDPDDFQKLKEVFTKIAAFLKWKLVEEDSDKSVR